MEIEKEKLVYLIASFFIIWMGIAIPLCYEMGKHGLDNIDWQFVFRSNIPVMIIAGSLIISAFKTKKENYENS